MTPQLRAWRVDDAEDCAEACNDPIIQRFVRHLPRPYTRADALNFISTAGPTQFAIVDDRRLLGAVGYTEDSRGCAEVGYWVAPWARRRGVATEALRQIGELPFARLVVRTTADNPASQRVAIAAGFTPEGVARGAGRDRDGSRYDLLVWARLKGDPPGPTPRLIPDFPDGRLTDGTVTLRMTLPGDVDDLVALHSLPDVYLHSVPPEPPSRERLAKQANEAESRWLAGQLASLVIEDTATGGYAGDLGVFYHEPRTQQAMLGYSLMPAWRGRGYASRAVRLVSAWAIPALGLARLVAGVEPANVASQRVLEAAGFTRESYERDRLPGPDGTRIDNVQYVRLA